MANGRKVGMTSNHHALYVLGYTHNTMAGTKGCQTARWSKSQKTDLSSDCRLQLACMKMELLVNADQNAALNTFPGLVHTARHTMKAGNIRSQRGYRDWETDRKSTRLNSSHSAKSRMPSSA